MVKTTTVVLGVAIVAAIGGVALIAPSADAHQNDPTNPHGDNATIDVSASAETATSPNLARVRVAVIAREDTADAAREQVAEDASSMRSALRDAGIGNDQIQTTYYDISAIHEERKNGTNIVGYRAAHGFEIEVNARSSRLGERTGQVIDTAVQNGANQVDGVEFTLSEQTRRQMRQRALGRAMENARRDASTLAADGGLGITGVTRASTADVSFSPYQDFRQDVADGGGTVIEPGPVQVSATVSVTYRAEARSQQQRQTTATGADVTVAQGETATVTVSASAVNRLQITAPSTDAIELVGFNDATLEPSPDSVLESLPPIWVWDSTVQSVTVTLPIAAPENLEPGTYRFTIRATGPSSGQTAQAPLNVRVVRPE
jgi:uncharacterized protein YggE